MKTLTTIEQNLIKDILKVIGKDDDLNTQFASAVGLSEDEFNQQTDVIFNKLQNGRLTVEGN